MPRKLEFNKDKVLSAAMQVFWEKGYFATSMLDLEAATDLRPGSIYNSFKSKEQLFIQVIEHYVEKIVMTRIDNILNQSAPLSGIQAFFESTYEHLEPDQLIGCLLTNSAAQYRFKSIEIRRHLTKAIFRIEFAFQARLEQAKQSGELSRQVDTAQLATYLVSCYQGLSIIGRLTQDSDQLRIITQQALASIKSAQ